MAIAAPPTTNTFPTTPGGPGAPERRKGSLDLCPAKENVTRLGHAASRFLAEQVDAVLAECRRRPDQRIGSLDLQFRREPRPLKYSHLGPFGRGSATLCGKMLS